jgi:hypothetical protein
VALGCELQIPPTGLPVGVGPGLDGCYQRGLTRANEQTDTFNRYEARPRRFLGDGVAEFNDPGRRMTRKANIDIRAAVNAPLPPSP